MSSELPNDPSLPVGTEKPNEAFDLILAGCGRVARKHLRAVALFERRFASVRLVDPSRATAEAAAEVLPMRLRETVRFYPTLDEALADGPADMVAITTPSDRHAPLARRALEAGAHVLVEKPLCLDPRAAYALADLAERQGRKIAVGHIYRYFPLIDVLKDDLEKGAFGKILQASVDLRWGHGQEYYDAAAWRGRWASDGGVLMNQTVHAVDLMSLLIGSKVVGARGYIDRKAHCIEADDYASAILEYENGVSLRIETTTNTSESRHRVEFFLLCEKASISMGLRGKSPFVRIASRNGAGGFPKRASYLLRFVRSLFSNFKVRVACAMQPHSAIYEDLIRAIDSGCEPLAPARDAAAAVETILGIYASAKAGGGRVRLPLEKPFLLEDMEGFFPPCERAPAANEVRSTSA